MSANFQHPPVLSEPLNLETVERKGRKYEKLNISWKKGAF